MVVAIIIIILLMMKFKTTAYLFYTLLSPPPSPLSPPPRIHSTTVPQCHNYSSTYKEIGSIHPPSYSVQGSCSRASAPYGPWPWPWPLLVIILSFFV